jgi:cell shape-determining protein MreD
MVYCGLNTTLGTTGLAAITGGLWFDTLSANPLGVSILPLFIVGFLAQRTRDVVLRDQLTARIILGAAGSAVAPLFSVLLLWGSGYRPLIGWGSLWQWLILAGAGGFLTPLCFWFFERLDLALAYSRQSETTFRPDREIKRGRA